MNTFQTATADSKHYRNYQDGYFKTLILPEEN
jgi:hypothetical protein